MLLLHQHKLQVNSSDLVFSITSVTGPFLNVNAVEGPELERRTDSWEGGAPTSVRNTSLLQCFSCIILCRCTILRAGYIVQLGGSLSTYLTLV